MSNIILVAETGSDIPPELARKHGIYLVPMHVSFENEIKDDGTFPVKEICDWYDKTGKLPKTSGCSPYDFKKVFDAIHAEFPDKHILHLAYSAVTTCSYQSAIAAADGVDYITSFDTKQVSGGQAIVVLEMARLLESDPEITPQQAVEAARLICRRARMCFLPMDLEYLRAGGRVSNVACLGGRLLRLHPCIEVLDGYLIAKKKYRGKLEKVIPALIQEYSQREQLDKKKLILIWSIGLPDNVRKIAEEQAQRCGFQSITWIRTGCVITTHGGPGCFGIVGFSKAE